MAINKPSIHRVVCIFICNTIHKCEDCRYWWSTFAYLLLSTLPFNGLGRCSLGLILYSMEMSWKIWADNYPSNIINFLSAVYPRSPLINQPSLAIYSCEIINWIQYQNNIPFPSNCMSDGIEDIQFEALSVAITLLYTWDKLHSSQSLNSVNEYPSSPYHYQYCEWISRSWCGYDA